MSKALSDSIFVFQGADRPTIGWERCSAGDLGLPESWFRDAIFEAPSIVIEACRAAGVTDDDWYPWAREFRTEVGPIDVLLVSSQGKVAIVETKLSSNPELRRQVLAQTLDYLAHLPEAFDDSMPPIPLDGNGLAVADVDDIRESVAAGDVLLIVASDDIDPRVARLSQSLIAENLVKGWELALVDMALFKPKDPASTEYLVVPTVRNLVLKESRQVVRIIVQGETPRARIQVERLMAVPEESESGRRVWNEDLFFERLAAAASPETVSSVRKLFDFARPLGEISWGSGVANPSMNPRFMPGSTRAPITVRHDGRLDFKLSWIEDAPLAPVFTATVKPLVSASGLSTEVNHASWTRWGAEEWVPHVDALITAFREGLRVARG